MAAFEAEIADDVDTAQEKEHEEEERRAYERVLEVVEAQRVMDQHLDEIKNKMREAKERRDAAAAQAKTVVSQKEEDMSDIDSDEEAAFEDFSNDWRARG
jgi:rhamnose utilization protein RhaD (predicted bifunctional aldolase and dehydrogenase)